MSASKARMAQDITQLRAEADEAHRLVVRLLRCLLTLDEDGVKLPDSFTSIGISEWYWRQV